MDRDFVQQRITAAKALLLVYDAALNAISTGGAQSYTMDTGQTKQTVTKIDIGRLNDMISSLENRIATLEARLHGGSTLVVPCW